MKNLEVQFLKNDIHECEDATQRFILLSQDLTLFKNSPVLYLDCGCTLFDLQWITFLPVPNSAVKCVFVSLSPVMVLSFVDAA